MDRIAEALQNLLPANKISRIHRSGNCTDISCYSNKLEDIFGWSATGGSKINQGIRVPRWIADDPEYTRRCLKGLFETDGSVYTDRIYLMANFVTATKGLADDVMGMLASIGFKANRQEIHRGNSHKYTIRIAKRTQEFIDMIGLQKN